MKYEKLGTPLFRESWTLKNKFRKERILFSLLDLIFSISVVLIPLLGLMYEGVSSPVTISCVIFVEAILVYYAFAAMKNAFVELKRKPIQVYENGIIKTQTSMTPTGKRCRFILVEFSNVSKILFPPEKGRVATIQLKDSTKIRSLEGSDKDSPKFLGSKLQILVFEDFVTDVGKLKKVLLEQAKKHEIPVDHVL